MLEISVLQQWINAARIHYICAIGIYMPQEATIRTRSKAGQASMYVWLRWTDVCCTFDLTVPKRYSNSLGSYNHPLYRPNLVRCVSFKNSHLKDFTTTTIPGLQFLESVSINVTTTTTNQCCCCYGNKSCQQPKTIQITLLLKNSCSVYSTISISHLQQCWLRTCYPHSNRNCMHEGCQNLCLSHFHQY